MGSMPSYDGMGMYGQFVHAPSNQPGMYNDMQPPPMVMPHQSYQQPPMFAGTQPSSLGTDRRIFIENDPSTAENLSDVLGELKIDETGIGMDLSRGTCWIRIADVLSVAPYLIRKGKTNRIEPEAPVQDDVEERLPPLSTGSGATIRIPPELMPADDDVMNYFQIYFHEIHPYVPVIPRAHMYYQWQNDRGAISPLLLEALFACAGRLSDEPSEGAQWLALANSESSPDFQTR